MAMEGSQWVRPGFGNELIPKIRERLIRLPITTHAGTAVISKAYRYWLLAAGLSEPHPRRHLLQSHGSTA